MYLRFYPVLCLLMSLLLAGTPALIAQNLGPSGTTVYAYDDGKPRPRLEPATPTAKQAYNDALKAYLRHDYPNASKLYRAAIEADPLFEQSHRSFINSVRESEQRADPTHEKEALAKANSQLLSAYDQWITQYPKQAAYMWGKANIYPFASAESDALLRRAIELDPGYVPAYAMLESSDLQHGDVEDRRKLLEKISSLKPDDPLAALEYVASYRHGKKVKMMSGNTLDAFASLLQRRIYERYPNDVIVVRGLAMQVADAPTLDQRRKFLEQAAKYVSKFPRDGQLRVLMGALFRLYSDNDPERAQLFAHQMMEAYPDVSSWKELASFQSLVNEGRAALDAGNAEPALDILHQATAMTGPLRLDVVRPWVLLARAYVLAKQPESGYEMLLTQTAKFPHKALVETLQNIGALAGRSSDQMRSDLLARVRSGAKPFGDFTFTDFHTGKPVSIRDYRGHVVFITFWFPSCGHCKEEYPYFEETLERYGNQGFVVLAPNVHTEEDEVAIENMRAYHFVLLKVPSPDWERSNFHSSEAPINFLLDGNGLVAFQPRVDDTEAQTLMEDEINLLLGDNHQSNQGSGAAH